MTIFQKKTAQNIINRGNSVTDSDVFKRYPLLPVRVITSMTYNSINPSATIIIRGGSDQNTNDVIATIKLSQKENHEEFTIYSTPEYLKAQITEIDGQDTFVTVIFDAVE